MKFKNLKRSFISTFALLLLVGVIEVIGQTSRGTITGTVTDQNDAVIEGATVELKEINTNLVRTVITNSAGIYRFDAVDLGTYDVTVSSKGFKPIVTKGLNVQANRVAELNIKLEVGAESVVVEVNAATTDLLQTSDTTRGGNFSPRETTKLPLSSLNPYDLARLLPGVAVPTGSGASFGNGTQVSINGQRPRANNFLLDGVENNDISVTGAATSINNEDAIAEVSVQTGLFSAEFGRAGGGVFNQITKSGTNEFHGTLRWLFLSEAFNATTNAQRLSGRTRPPVFTENVYGGTVGGPVFFPNWGDGGPGIYDGRDRTFFFFGLQFDKFRSTANFGNFRVPTEAGFQRLRTLFPAGTNPRVDTYLNAIGSARGITSISNIALGANPTTGVDRGSIETGLVGIPSSQLANARQWLLRIDHNINSNQRLSFRYSDDRSITTPSAMDSPFYIRDFQGNSPNFLATHNWVINSGLTNEFRFSYGKIDFNFPISPNAPAEAFTLQNISIAGLSAIGIATNIPQFRIAKNYLYQDTMTKVWGKHTLRFGFEFLKQNALQRPPFNERGSFSITNGGTNPTGGTYTALANYIDNFSGPNGSANINFGTPEYDPSLFRQSYFVQDTWKFNSDLTLNLGLRYENFGQPANNAFKYPAFAGFDPANFLVPNKVNPDNNNFGPIVGFAYSPSFDSGIGGFIFGEKQSSLRAGYQISYDTFFNNLLSNIAADSPNNTATTTNGASTGRGTANFFPNAIPSTPRSPSVLDQQTSVFDPNVKNPYTQRWSLGFQRQIPFDIVWETSYVGTVGHKLFVTEELNPRVNGGNRLFPALGIRRQRASGANSYYHALQVRVDKRFSRGFAVNSSYTFSKLMDQISEVFATDSSASSLASIPVNQGGLKLDYAVSDYHRKNRLTVAYNWQIPGPRKGWLSPILGGWETSGIVTLQSGAPFTIINGLDRDGDGNLASDRPNLGNPNAPRNTRAVIVLPATCATGYRNPDNLQCVNPFTDVYVYQVATNSGFPGAATLGRNTERSRPVKNVDMSFFKTFYFTETLKLEYRLEAFNIFNTPQFTGVPGRNVTSTLAGQYFNYDLLSGGGRTMRMGLKILF